MRALMKFKWWAVAVLTLVSVALLSTQCAQKPTNTVMGGGADKVYVAPGAYDDFYAFMSGGFSGQVSVYGLPSGRMLKVIPVSHRTRRTRTATAKRPRPC